MPGRRATFGVLALAALACDGPTAPGSPAPLRLSGETVPGVSVVLLVQPASPAGGDTVTFTVTATNSTSERIQLGMACGPAFDVQVTVPTGTRRSVLSDLVGPDGAFPCLLSPEHFVESHGSRSAELRWRVPLVRGRYSARAGLRRSDGMGNLSGAVEFFTR